MINKRLAHAVSLIIRDDAGRYLIVKRPDDPDDDIAGVWGFPAIGALPGESETQTAHRVAREKLGITVELGRRIGESTHDRGDRLLHLVDFEARILSGEPVVPQPDTAHTQYVDFRFTEDPLSVVEAARQGSQCTQIFLDDLGFDWRPGE